MNRFKKTEEKKWILIGIASLIMVIIFLAVRLFSSNNMIVEETQNIMTSSTTLESTEVISDRTDDMFVDIKGAVKNPGIYQVTGNMRVLNVVELAGGFLSEADDKQVNLSERVVDQMVIYIPKEGEKLEDLSLIKANEKSEQESST